jgi:hypothetical protein
MFLEASYENSMSFNLLDKKYSYSFVVQQPENRIVVPFKSPQLYLVAVYSIVNDNNALSFEFWGCAPINTQVFSLSIDIKL